MSEADRIEAVAATLQCTRHWPQMRACAWQENEPCRCRALVQCAGVMIESLGGNCPVYAEGTIDGKSFYFRARGAHWTVEIGALVDGEPEWSYREAYGTWPDAGWMEEEEAVKFIEQAAARYRAEQEASQK